MAIGLYGFPFYKWIDKEGTARPLPQTQAPGPQAGSPMTDRPGRDPVEDRKNIRGCWSERRQERLPAVPGHPLRQQSRPARGNIDAPAQLQLQFVSTPAPTDPTILP